MTAIKKDELERLEAEYGLSEDGLTYQHRCSRITAVMKGEEWVPPKKFAKHHLYGKRILITPMMTPEGKRFLTYDEPLGPVIETRDYNAGEAIYGKPEDVKRMVGDYEIVNINHSQKVIAKSSVPKVNTEISWCLGKELCPVVRGNDGKKGYIWSYPTSVIKVGDSLIQVYGLKTLIRMVYPELEPKFSGKPMMDYVDGVTLVASIPQTHALLKEHRRKELLDAKAGLI